MSFSILLRIGLAGLHLANFTAPLSVNALPTAKASWYYDAGQTACGFHNYFGVANRTLACGTKVTFYYNNKAVKAVVDDRGPFVYDRLWDLNQSVRGTLACPDICYLKYKLGWYP